MLIARSLVFNVLFYLHISLRMVALLVLLPFPRKTMVRAVQAWTRDNLKLLKVVTGTTVEFGGLAARAGMVPVDRGAGSSALADMNERAREEAARGRHIVIFPEGTRRPPGAEPAYKFGIAHLYGNLDIPCVPIALNSGLYWPRRRFIRRPGTILVEILDPIPPGLPRKEFMDELQTRLEAASARLLAEGTARLSEATAAGSREIGR